VTSALPNRASAAARARRRWSAALGADPREHALLAVAECWPRRVLDVGSGDGEFAEWCARRLTAEIVAVDQSAWLTNPRAGGVGALPHEAETFDVVAANEALPGVRDLDAALAELARLLRPGGRLVALTASERYLEPLLAPQAFTFSAEDGAEALRRHFHRVDRREIVGEVVFPSREAVRGFLRDLDEVAAVDVDTLPEPYRATVRTAVFVAEKGA
jgi:ubiquinone/menaquinone biosynthesis C-methylase UbiE